MKVKEKNRGKKSGWKVKTMRGLERCKEVWRIGKLVLSRRGGG